MASVTILAATVTILATWGQAQEQRAGARAIEVSVYGHKGLSGM